MIEYEFNGFIDLAMLTCESGHNLIKNRNRNSIDLSIERFSNGL